MLDTIPDRTSSVWKNDDYDEVLHDPLRYLPWVATKFLLSHTDGCVQNFLKGLKEGLLTDNNEKEWYLHAWRHKAYPPSQ